MQIFLLVADEDEGSLEETLTNLDSNPTEIRVDLSPTQISFHAIAGHVVPETLRLVGLISNQKVHILIDGGSTHNFIRHHLVFAFGLKPQSTTPLRMTVGNRDELECHQLCNVAPMHIQGQAYKGEAHEEGSFGS